MATNTHHFWEYSHQILIFARFVVDFFLVGTMLALTRLVYPNAFPGQDSLVDSERQESIMEFVAILVVAAIMLGIGRAANDRDDIHLSGTHFTKQYDSPSRY